MDKERTKMMGEREKVRKEIGRKGKRNRKQIYLIPVFPNFFYHHQQLQQCTSQFMVCSVFKGSPNLLFH
jgi:hypothetical protein